MNCETFSYGGNDEYNNCTTCPTSGKKFFDLGNCVEKCENGNFIDNSIIVQQISLAKFVLKKVRNIIYVIAVILKMNIIP